MRSFLKRLEAQTVWLVFCFAFFFLSILVMRWLSTPYDPCMIFMYDIHWYTIWLICMVNVGEYTSLMNPLSTVIIQFITVTILTIPNVSRESEWTQSLNNLYQVLQSDLVRTHKWPFHGLSGIKRSLWRSWSVIVWIWSVIVWIVFQPIKSQMSGFPLSRGQRIPQAIETHSKTRQL